MSSNLVLLVVLGLIAVAIVIFMVVRGARRREIDRGRAGAEPYVASRDRPYMKAVRDGPQGNSVADEVATATTDVAGEVLGIDARPAESGPSDDLSRLKGVGPKFVARLNELGITRYDQLAQMNANEAAHLDERLGPFQGRLARDRIVEQADYLARGDSEGFEEKFGKLTP
jgi:predicted flap endonuclease-1-like 5' DNA nuclease